MGSLTRDCPHDECRVRNGGFTSIAEGQNAFGRMFLMATCNSCHGRILVELSPRAKGVPRAIDCHQIALENCYEEVAAWPQPPKLHPVDHLPGNVAAAYLEAEQNRADGRYPTAGMAYRRAIERALKHLAPDGKGMLNARIRQIEAAGALPHGLIELLDTVKLLGNDAAHEDEDPDAADVARAAEFTRLFFIYTFDLPAQVAAAQAQRNGGGA
jgi:hypothetical protein